MAVRPIQTAFLAFIFLYDVIFLYNQYDFHVKNREVPGHKDTYRPIFGIDSFRMLMPFPRLSIVIHIVSAILPLVLSVTQVSAFIRSRSLEGHRWGGRICLSCAAVSCVPALQLAFTNDDSGPFEKFLVACLGVIWVISIVQTWRTAAAGDVATHRQWGTRFAYYTHCIPLIARITALVIWILLGMPSWGFNEDGTPHCSDPRIFPRLVWVTAFFTVAGSEIAVAAEGWQSSNKAKKA